MDSATYFYNRTSYFSIGDGMKQLTTTDGKFGPYKDVTEFDEFWLVDGATLPKHIIGPSQVEDWDGQYPVVEKPLPDNEDVYMAAMEALYDKVAQTKQYDNRLTCALRAGYPGPFQAEGLAFGSWMDTCNEFGYYMLARVTSGDLPQPTVDEFMAQLPEMEWP